MKLYIYLLNKDCGKQRYIVADNLSVAVTRIRKKHPDMEIYSVREEADCEVIEGKEALCQATQS